MEELPIISHSTLISSLLSSGEMRLFNGDMAGLLDFSAAETLGGDDLDVLLRKGNALFELGASQKKEKILFTAARQFKKIVSIDPTIALAWHTWGCTLFLIAKLSQKKEPLIEAKEKFLKAVELSSSSPAETRSELFWDLGSIFLEIGHFSEEASDFQEATKAFSEALLLNPDPPPEFWRDYGEASYSLAKKMPTSLRNHQAIQCLKRSLAISPTLFESWHLLGEALKLAFFETNEEELFWQSYKSYTNALFYAKKMVPGSVSVQKLLSISLDATRFTIEAAQLLKDPIKLKLAIELSKTGFSDGTLLQENFFELPFLAIWAEALAALGEIKEDAALLQEARQKIQEIQKSSQDLTADIYASLGNCFNSFGSYFEELEFHLEAVEKYSEGVSLDRTVVTNWIGLGKSFFLIGKETCDLKDLEKAYSFYQKAETLAPSAALSIAMGKILSLMGNLKNDESLLLKAAEKFEQVFTTQKNVIYTHPEWIFFYATLLDEIGDFHEEEDFYLKAIDLFSQVLTIDPEFPEIHHRLALTLSHLGELVGESVLFQKAIHHFKIALKKDSSHDLVILDFGVSLMNMAECSKDPETAHILHREAEQKLILALQLGNLQTYYHLGCLYSILGEYEKSISFIEKAYESETLPPIEEVLEDDWLSGLRSTSYFQKFISHFEK